MAAPDRKTTRIRRRKHTEGQTVVPVRHKDAIKEVARQTEDLGLQILELQNQIKDNTEQMMEYMTKYGDKSVPAEYGDYTYAVPKGRGSTVVSSKEFQDRVTEEEFHECISVSVTKARQVLSEKEVSEISDKTAGKPGAPIVAYKKRK